MYEIGAALSITGPVVSGIALNLYWNKEKTHDKIYTGKYANIGFYF